MANSGREGGYITCLLDHLTLSVDLLLVIAPVGVGGVNSRHYVVFDVRLFLSRNPIGGAYFSELLCYRKLLKVVMIL